MRNEDQKTIKKQKRQVLKIDLSSQKIVSNKKVTNRSNSKPAAFK